MNEQLDLSKYQDKKLIAFDLYWTCLKNPLTGWLSWDLVEMMEKIPITLWDILNWKIEKPRWTKLQISDDLVEYIRKDIEWTLLFPETLKILKNIKSKWYKTAVVSNLSKDYAKPLNKLIPDWLFDYEVLSFEIWVVKPDPKIYEYLKSLSWINFEDMVMVWDSLKSDIEWSYNVRITPIYVNRSSKSWIKEVEKLIWWANIIEIPTLRELINIF